MKDLVQKKLNFDGFKGMIDKLNKIEQRLNENQARDDYEEQKAIAGKTDIRGSMAEALYNGMSEVDRETLSKSSGGRTATTRDSDEDFEASSFAISAK